MNTKIYCIKTIGILILHLMSSFSLICQGSNYELNNITFFENGEYKYVENIYVSDGLFTESRTTTIDSILDFRDKFLIPLLAEGHTHSLENVEALPYIIEEYKKSGVYNLKSIIGVNTSFLPIRKSSKSQANLQVNLSILLEKSITCKIAMKLLSLC